MSRQNKVNKSNYDQAGRLTPDDMARERKKMMRAADMAGRDRVRGKEAEPRRQTAPADRGEPASSQARAGREESE